MSHESPLVRCELPIEDIQVIAAARGSKVRGVLLADGRIDEALKGDPGEYSVSSLALDLEERVIVCAESVDFGPRAEIFRLRVFTETGSSRSQFSQRMRSATVCPTGLDLAGVCERTFQPVILRFLHQMTVQLIPGMETRINVIVDGALLLIGPTGAKLLVEHDHQLPLSLRISTYDRVIDRVIARATELVVI